MHWFSLAVALLAALAIIFIGVRYLTDPRSMAPSFGLPLPEAGSHIPWWLRLKGVRDIVSGLVVLALMVSDGHQALGLVLLIEALIPLGDMSVVLAAKGRTATALGVHGVTALLMVLGAVPLLVGTA
ncbi:DUF4267 domain-containing protein [Lichenihabitans sp. Uapishka_5]|uniref:DUF4267 domain-containing protein n=1 Tax=Lichenihabitans sp. Uapishka_5 TaxID=3037302 RepID=UPI0029E81452|nr:DUF4267 domain-containing protein [Lichenihabitans sp. Uapishka_5]MDX7951470.1 DUF4267 domain-containing protein [Lichenihabitans sp. Uapishka_5]